MGANDRALAVVARPGLPALPSQAEWQTMLQLGDQLFRSGMLPQHIRSAQAALAVIEKGRELQVPPMYALSNIVVIQGKPTANAELMLALIYRDHGDDAMRFVESTTERCTVAYKRRGWSKPETYAFTIEDAARAGLVGGKNPTWSAYPQAMLRARAVSAVARMAFADTIGGLYTPEELGAPVEVDDDGFVNVVSVDAPPAPVEPIPARRADAAAATPRSAAAAAPASPAAQHADTGGDAATPAQVRAIRTLGRNRHGLSEAQTDAACAAAHGGRAPDALTKREASAFVAGMQAPGWKPPAAPLPADPADNLDALHAAGQAVSDGEYAEEEVEDAGDGSDLFADAP